MTEEKPYWPEKGYKLELHFGNKLCWCDWFECRIIDVPVPYSWRYVVDSSLYYRLSIKRADAFNKRWLALRGE